MIGSSLIAGRRDDIDAERVRRMRTIRSRSTTKHRSMVHDVAIVRERISAKLTRNLTYNVAREPIRGSSSRGEVHWLRPLPASLPRRLRRKRPLPRSPLRRSRLRRRSNADAPEAFASELPSRLAPHGAVARRTERSSEAASSWCPSPPEITAPEELHPDDALLRRVFLFLAAAWAKTGRKARRRCLRPGETTVPSLKRAETKGLSGDRSSRFDWP